MPAETANYLPKLQAIKNIVRDPEKFGLALADIPDAPYFAVVKTNRKMDTKFAAELAEMSLEDFLALNPQHNRPVIAGADEQTLLLPIDNAEIFAAKLDLTNQPMVSWQAYRMRPNETLAAGRGQIRDVGGDAARRQRHRREGEGAGRAYAARAVAERVDRSGRVAVAGGVHHGSRRAARSTTRRRRATGSAVIAVRYGVTAQELKSWNGISSDALAPGQKVRVTSDVVPVRKAGGRTKRAVATKGAGKQAQAGAKSRRAKPVAAKNKPVAANPPASNTARTHANPGG